MKAASSAKKEPGSQVKKPPAELRLVLDNR
jgi:hypothetical protein